jgi:hypothetical protein
MTNSNTDSVSSTPDIPIVVNPLMSRIKLPGETFTLPSGGIFYTNDELDPSVKNAEVHVHPMTVLDEIVIKTPDMLFSGEAVYQVFERCIPQIKKPSQLLAKDVDFLLLCLRKVSYGPTIEMNSIHYDCKVNDEEEKHTYLVDINQFIQNTKRIDPTTIDHMFNVTLDNEQVVKMQPVKFADFVNIMQTHETTPNMTPTEQVAVLVESLSNIILAVDEITNKDMIKEWLSNIHPTYLNKLNNCLDQTIAWGPDFKYKFSCKDCQLVQEVTAPVNPLAFFT